ncbi:cell wall-binding repeat-containing protein [Catenulispora yoronensis]
MLGAAHTYKDPNANPTTTVTLLDNAGWEWKWTYTPRTDQQVPAVSSPPSPGGWVAGGSGGGTTPPPGGGTTPPPPGGGTTPPPTGGGSGQPVVTRLGGSDRYATAQTVSAAQWQAGRAAAVVLARGDQAPDALAGVPLAALKGGPLLLTDPAALDRGTRSEIDRVLGGPGSKKTIYILGGSSAVSPSVEQELQRAGYTVKRLFGSARYSTALAVAGEFPAGKEAVVATGLDFPDALAAGPLAAQRSAPIVLSEGNVVSGATAAFLRGKGTVDAVGGAAVKAVKGLVGSGGSGPVVNTYAGADRFATALDVAGALAKGLGRPVTGVGVAYAFNFPDALTGGAFAATAGQPLLLTDRGTADPGLVAALKGFGTGLKGVEIFGGTSVVSQGVEDQIARTIGGIER